ncbi:MAG: NfeD family protein [Lachnospiraceae bacterium]|nr:NfeD family protein [Lachnospiraceae bacterium]
MNWLIVWIVVAVVMAIIEAFTLGLTTIWFAGGAVIAAIFAGFGAPIAVQVIRFAVVSLGLLFFTRPLVSKGFNKTRTLTNSEGLVGKHAYVTEDIDNVKATGKIKVDGMEWSARTLSDGIQIATGALVEVKSIEGVKTIVEEIKEAK